MSKANSKNLDKATDMEIEEKRLLDSFKLHEMEVGKNDSSALAAKDNETLYESQVESPEYLASKRSETLQKEGEILGGTFGDPNKLPKKEHLDYSQKSDEEHMTAKPSEAKPAVRHEPGPAFTNSSFKEGSPNRDGDLTPHLSENPFYWADNNVGDNLDKLVSYIHQVKSQRTSEAASTCSKYCL